MNALKTVLIPALLTLAAGVAMAQTPTAPAAPAAPVATATTATPGSATTAEAKPAHKHHAKKHAKADKAAAVATEVPPVAAKAEVKKTQDVKPAAATPAKTS